MIWSLAVLVLMLATFPALYFTCTTWMGAGTAAHADRTVVRAWKHSAFAAIGTFQIATSLALLLFAIEQDDWTTFLSGGYAPALMGIGFIVGPRLRITQLLEN